jgi:histidyl-tRNA synthetase
MAAITPLSGFPELLPSQQKAFDGLKRTLEQVFLSFGYQGMETPAVEKMSTLLSKGAAEQEIYTLRRYQEEQPHTEAELGLRFDLTVPLARYVAQHQNALSFPFRRYQIAPVWRGERPQKGRYRQFYQCDIDIIGENTLSKAHDAEALSVLVTALKSIGINDFQICLNHKKILIGACYAFDLDEQQHADFLRLLDKQQKISAQDFKSQLQVFLTPSAMALFESFCQCQGTLDEALLKLEALPITHAVFQEGIAELQQICALLKAFNVSDKILLQVSLARGLSYYTGVVFETFLIDAPHLGSIASGGRYDGLTQHFTQRRHYPGVGLSIGISRLFSYLLETQDDLKHISPYAQALILIQQIEALPDYIALAQYLRSQNCAVELYLESKSFAEQLKYAQKRCYRWIISGTAQEIDQKKWFVKDLRHQTQYQIAQEDIGPLLKIQ